MPKKIEKLSPRQEIRMAEVLREWLDVGRSTKPIDRSKVDEIVAEFYHRIGKPRPKILYFSSPVVCILAWAAFGSKGQLWGQLRGQLWDQLRGQLEGQLEGQLRDQLWGQLGNCFAGGHRCAWEVFYKFCSEIGVKYSVEQEELLELWLRQSREMHWWFPYDGIVFVSERHTVVEVDAQGRLHSETGQACGYSDKWGVWAWHGVRVSQRIIEQPETITVKEIMAEQNTEIRRIMIERIGLERFVQESGAREIHRHDMGTLFEIDLGDDPERVLKAVKVVCPSTGRIYFLRVPPAISRADDAVAWSFGFDVTSEYRPILET